MTQPATVALTPAAMRCTECGTEWGDDEYLPYIVAPDGEIVQGCPACETDEYLMGIPREPTGA